MTTDGAALIWCPFADDDSASAVASVLLEEGHVACVNILPGVHSLYVWQGQRGESREVGVLFKTNAARLGPAIARLEALHPYEAPAIAGWTCDAVGKAAGAWLAGLGEP